MDNIIDLQSVKQKKEEDRFDELVQDIDDHEETIDLFCVKAVQGIVGILIDEFGCDMYANHKTIYDIISIVEHIKSLSYRARSEEYPLQTYTDMLLENCIDDPEEMLHQFMNDEYY